MTVRELMVELNKHDPNAEVIAVGEEGPWEDYIVQPSTVRSNVIYLRWSPYKREDMSNEEDTPRQRRVSGLPGLGRGDH